MRGALSSVPSPFLSRVLSQGSLAVPSPSSCMVLHIQSELGSPYSWFCDTLLGTMFSSLGFSQPEF